VCFVGDRGRQDRRGVWAAFRIGMDVQEPFFFRLDTSLLIVHRCPNEKGCGAYYYEWRDLKLHQIK